MAASFTITGFMIFVPWMFASLDLLVKDDTNSEATRRRIYQSLAKTVLLEMTLLIVVVLTYYEEEAASSGKICWENGVGQEMYRLLLLFLVGLVLFTFIMEYAYKLVQPW